MQPANLSKFLLLTLAASAPPLQAQGAQGPNAAAAQSAPMPALPPEALFVERLNQRFAALRAEGFSGVAIVEIGGRIVFRGAAGLADPATGRAFTPDTPVLINSLAKLLTAAAILKLQDRGLLSLDDPVSRFFPDLPRPLALATLRQLLTHSAGLGDVAAGSSANPDLEAVDRPTFLQRLTNTPLRFAPGAGYQYSNAGYSLLAAVIEQVSGRPYNDFIRAEIVAPAGVTRIGQGDGYNPADAERTRDGRTIAETHWGPGGPHWNLLGNGGTIVVAEDFVRWRRAFASGRIVSAAMVRAAGTPQVPLPQGGGEGFGSLVAPSRSRGMVEMAAGGSAFFTSDILYYRDLDMIVFVAGNAGRAAPNVASALVFAGFGEAEPEAPAGNPAEVELANRFGAAVLDADAGARRRFIEAMAGPRFRERVGIEEIGRQFDAAHQAVAGMHVGPVTRDTPMRLLLSFVDGDRRVVLEMMLGGTPDAPRVAGFAVHQGP